MVEKEQEQEDNRKKRIESVDINVSGLDSSATDTSVDD